MSQFFYEMRGKEKVRESDGEEGMMSQALAQVGRGQASGLFKAFRD